MAHMTVDLVMAMELGELHVDHKKTSEMGKQMLKSFKLSMANLMDISNKNALQAKKERFLPRIVLQEFCQMMAMKNFA